MGQKLYAPMDAMGFDPWMKEFWMESDDYTRIDKGLRVSPPVRGQTEGCMSVACCDCGLVHAWQWNERKDLNAGRKVVFIVPYRDNRRTAQLRRHGEPSLISEGVGLWRMVRR